MPVKTPTLDVFFCFLPGRESVTARCEHAWADLDVTFHPITNTALSCAPMVFQKQRRVYAEDMAQGEVYIVADDDCLPPLGNWLETAVDILDRHPEFAILSLWPENASIQRWTPEGYTPHEDADVMEHFSVGGIRVCRKGILKDWPAIQGKAYDTEHCQAIRDLGYRVGYFRELRMSHLGEGRTTLR